MIKNKIEFLRTSLKPDLVTIEDQRKTRFGATPHHKDTFVNIEAS